MKRLILLVVSILLLTGCVRVDTNDYKNIINETVTAKNNIYNTYRNGYKFYLPRGLYVVDHNDYNETIKNKGYTYYLYIDLVSYLNKKENTYVESNTSYYSKIFSNGEKFGYLEINNKKDKYLVEIMYNYAKIEVMVDKSDLSNAVTNSIIILSSIYYNDGVLNNYVNGNVLNYNEENVDIFKTKGRETSNFLKYEETYDVDQNPQIPDYDLIN